MKQVIVVNHALRLPRGKLAAQVAHASVAALLHAPEEAWRAWLAAGMPKIVLRVDSEDALLAIERHAAEAELPAALIRDGGLTVLPEGTITCLGVGPAVDQRVDAVTGELRLL